jgi:hypothetical protein
MVKIFWIFVAHDIAQGMTKAWECGYLYNRLNEDGVIKSFSGLLWRSSFPFIANRTNKTINKIRGNQ